MKKAEEYFEKIPYSFDIPNIKEWVCDQIRCAQKDTIRETVQACADNAKILFHDGFWKENKRMEYFQSGENNLQISKDSILEVADKLIKELE